MVFFFLKKKKWNFGILRDMEFWKIYLKLVFKKKKKAWFRISKTWEFKNGVLKKIKFWKI